jgi:hypothetical protein
VTSAAKIKNENHINSHHKLFIYSPTTESRKCDYISSLLTERLASVCPRAALALWTMWTLWTLPTASLSQSSPKCYTHMKTYKLCHVINFKKWCESIPIAPNTGQLYCAMRPSGQTARIWRTSNHSKLKQR